MSQKVFISLPFSLSHVLAIIISYIPFESLKSQNSSCETHFEIGHCVTIEMVLQDVLAVSSRLAAVSYYSLLESKLFIILTKYISLERSESQDSIFCDRCNIESEIDRFVTEVHWSLDAPGGCLWYNA